MKKKNMLLAIDGSSALNEFYFATLPLSLLAEKDKDKREAKFNQLKKTENGLYINAVEGMMKMILKFLREYNPSHMAVAWDITRDTFRRDIYPLYKGNRPDVDKPLIEQFETMQEILKQIGIPQFYDSKYEADDYLGTLSKKFEDEIPVFIYTKDKDALQLVSDRTKLWLITNKADEFRETYGIDIELFKMPKKAFEFNPMYVKEIFGVDSENIVDLKALVGDKGDNIPGVKGIGDTSAIPLINHYGSVENLFSELKDLSKEDIKELKEMWKTDLEIKRSPINMLLKEEALELAMLSKKLGTIVRDIPLNISSSDLKVDINIENLKRMSDKYDLNLNVDRLLNINE